MSRKRFPPRRPPYGRQLSQYPHIHLSVTRGGLDIKHSVWRDLFFKKHVVEQIWRGAVIRLLHHSYNLIIPGSLPGLGYIRDKKQWQRYLQAQYGRRWKVHFTKESLKYLGQSLKRPPVSAAKLRHHSGGAHYYNHRTQQYRQQTLTLEEMIARYISHILAKDFKMVRHYGFLSNRKRRKLLPQVYKALEMEARKTGEARLCWADEGISAHGSVQMHSVRQSAALQRCTGRQVSVGASSRKVA